MLELINVKKIYTTKAGDVAALDGVSLKFQDSGMIFINGKSGSGKTTLLNVVGGLDDFDSGEIIIDGKKFSNFEEPDYDSYRNTFVGFIFQEYNLLPDYTVEKNIMIANELQGKETSKEHVAKLMEEFDIAGLQHRKINELSGGQKQRVAIVRSLVKNPKIIMADEPTGALDSVTGVQVVETLKKLSKDKLVIVVSHDLELAEKYADRIIRIVDGKIVEDVSITDTEIKGNIHVDELGVTIRNGATLNFNETEELLNAIRERRKVNFTERVTVRKKEKTKEIKASQEEGKIKLINSKMKYQSAAELGIKSLTVKPGRLIFTVILSVIAFAVFGLFDTVAAYKDARVIQHLLKKSDYDAISVYQTYSQDSPYYYDSQNANRNLIKFSDSDIETLNKETGYNFRPVYDLDDTAIRTANNLYDIKYIDDDNLKVGTSLATSIGEPYYIPKVSGIVEFKDSEIEFDDNNLDENGNPLAKVIDKNGFNLKLKYGNLPKFFNENGVCNYQEVAISEYLAESILYWQGGKDDSSLMNPEHLLGATIKFDKGVYIVKGIYECGEIPRKYNELKSQSKGGMKSLSNEFKIYLNSGLYFNFIVGEGYIDYIKNDYENKNRIPSLFNHGKTYEIAFEGNTVKEKTNIDTRVFYNVKDFAPSKIAMFDEERNENIVLASDEIIISVEDLPTVYKQEFSEANKVGSYSYTKEQITAILLDSPEVEFTTEMRTEVKRFANLIKNMAENSSTRIEDDIKTVKIDILEDGVSKGVKEFKVVGVYTGVDTDINSQNSKYLLPLVLSADGLQEVMVNPNQGVYGRAIAPMVSSRKSTKALSKKMTNNDINLAWYENSVLEDISYNGEMIMQFANLFLYVALVLAAFSIFMLYNYISASIVSKKQSIGVLRALGSGGKDIFLMFITESLIIALINGILASIVAGIGCIFVNLYIKNVMNLVIDFALYGARQVIIIMIASIVTAVASSLIPIIKIAKEKPVKLIREP